MAEALDRELATLGVPFFIPGDKRPGEGERNALKKRMLELLLDLVDDNDN